jgi:hypothetical protein
MELPDGSGFCMHCGSALPADKTTPKVNPEPAADGGFAEALGWCIGWMMHNKRATLIIGIVCFVLVGLFFLQLQTIPPIRSVQATGNQATATTDGTPSAPPTTKAPADSKRPEDYVKVRAHHMTTVAPGLVDYSFTLENSHPSKSIREISVYVGEFTNDQPPFLLPDHFSELDVSALYNVNDQLAGRDILKAGEKRTFTFKNHSVPVETKVYKLHVSHASFMP